MARRSCLGRTSTIFKLCAFACSMALYFYPTCSMKVVIDTTWRWWGLPGTIEFVILFMTNAFASTLLSLIVTFDHLVTADFEIHRYIQHETSRWAKVEEVEDVEMGGTSNMRRRDGRVAGIQVV